MSRQGENSKINQDGEGESSLGDVNCSNYHGVFKKCKHRDCIYTIDNFPMAFYCKSRAERPYYCCFCIQFDILIKRCIS